MKTRVVSFGVLAFVVVLLAQCVNHSAPEGLFNCQTSAEVSFATDVQPILQSSCAITGDGGCHDGGNGASRDWRVFSNVQSHALQIKDRVTRPAGASGHMPKIGTITDAQIRTLVCWVEQGAKAN
ncbi:hypothetical protein [Chryseolinea lacunae]|uniref:Cytochrome c domain-containing protein n=1 Tax=Chryseolinea lacunae TaxID=2801331 RepID=A0ABS1KXW3_9BACT|nr:hypothetical protein [Chryseolinea lacunae]MBL0744299.1 hypothetical protein [Chryseolinea lacunae]